MQPDEWNTCQDPQAMLNYLRRRVSARKLRLFACACCRRLWSRLVDERDRKGVELAEQHADGLATIQQILHARSGVRGGPGRPSITEALWLPAKFWWPEVTAENAAIETSRFAVEVLGRGEEAVQCDLLRDLIALPAYRPTLAAVLGWDGGIVARLANGIYEERSQSTGQFDPVGLAVLADALVDAGIEDEGVLHHLRGTNPHVRGCWAIDLLLGWE